MSPTAAPPVPRGRASGLGGWGPGWTGCRLSSPQAQSLLQGPPPLPREPASPVTPGVTPATRLWPDARRCCRRLAQFPRPPTSAPALALVATCPLIPRAQGTQSDPGEMSSSCFLDCRGRLGSAGW